MDPSGAPRKLWFELWGTYAVAFLGVVSVAILLPTGPSRLGVSVGTYAVIYSSLRFLATLSGILGGLALLKSVTFRPQIR